MHLGVDFGTARTIVAYADRGNYPVVRFVDHEGDAHEFFPTVVSERDGRLVHGFDALQAAAEGGPLLRSFKRLLADPQVSPTTPVSVGDVTVPLLDLMTSFLSGLRSALATRSSVADLFASAEGDTVVAVPAHAHGAQRFITLEAFRNAGFHVTGMVNEPSAAGFEYTHHRGNTITSRRTHVVVYDLGGGTFDASLVTVDGTNHDVVGSLGVNDLGGDDFDDVLVRSALAAADVTRTDLTRREYRQLTDEARDAKERLTPQSKRIALDVGERDVMVRTNDYYEAAAPLVRRSIDAMAPLISGLDEGDPDLTDIAGIYLVGGASGLPLVPRLLKEQFGRRVHRSPYPAASTAIGLAIAADPDAGYSLRDRLWRGFGVFREASEGRALAFDAILDREATLPDQGEGPVTITRTYRAAHNIGYFRFVEYSGLDEHSQPRGSLVPFAEAVFPFDPELQQDSDLTDAADSPISTALQVENVQRRENGPMVEETYAIDSHGLIEVRIRDLDTGFERTYRLDGD